MSRGQNSTQYIRIGRSKLVKSHSWHLLSALRYQWDLRHGESVAYASLFHPVKYLILGLLMLMRIVESGLAKNMLSISGGGSDNLYWNQESFENAYLSTIVHSA